MQKSKGKLEDRVRNAMIAFRKRRHISQREFAEQMGWQKHIVGDLESGRTAWTLDKVEKVCERYERPAEYFINFEEDALEQTGIQQLLKKLNSDEKRIVREFLEEMRYRDLSTIEKLLVIARQIFPLTKGQDDDRSERKP